jgi:hypothetical protein
MNYQTSKMGNVIGIISLVIFVVCTGWGALLSAPELKELHFNLLRIFYPGYGAGLAGIIIGAVEAYIYGWLIGAGFVWLCKRICK